MRHSLDIPVTVPRQVVCAGCGAEFACALSGDCWCVAAPARLPMPADGGDCLCPACLRKWVAGRRADTD